MTVQLSRQELATDSFRLSTEPGTRGMRLSVPVDGVWRSIGTLTWGRLVVAVEPASAELQAQRASFDLAPTDGAALQDGVSLSGLIDDGTLGSCRFGVELRRTGTREISVVYWAIPSRDCRLVHFGGPSLSFDDQLFQSRDDALFPGLEWLLAGEQASDTANAAPVFARRNAPHPYKVTVPLMALSSGGIAAGLWWDPNQLWCNAHAYVGAEYALPDLQADVQDGATRPNRIGLFVPPAGSAWTAENSTAAHHPYSVPAGARLAIAATLCAGPAPVFAGPQEGAGQPPRAHGSLVVLERWLAAQGSIAPPPLPRDWSAALALCLHSYTAQSWDPEARAWHHTLADTSGPRYEPGVALQLWQAARRGLLGEAELPRAIVRAGVDAGRARQSHNAVTHLDLAFSYGGLAPALQDAARSLAELARRQRPDGAFPFQPKEERQQQLGRQDDSSSGITAEAALRFLRFARMTGDPAAETAGLRGAAYLRSQPRPEGAQTWELQVHVPDVLAAAYGVGAAMEAHHLTGDPSYLDEAERWALAGLPFVYLWNPMFRPIMRYGTIPVFGATFFDAQSWFGVLVQWNGLVYARALLDLAAARPHTRWRSVAEGVIANGVQQQAPDGPLAGMYPDAFSAPRGDEEYTWWLTPTLLGHALFALDGEPVDPCTLVARTAAGRYHVTAADSLSDLTLSDRLLAVTLQAPDAGGTVLLSGPGLERAQHVAVDGSILTEAVDLDAVDAGHRWLEEPACRLVKPSRSGQMQITCAW